MANRSLLRQLEQIRRSATYDDTIANANTSSVAEPTVSGSLESDLNIMRTLVKELKGSANWYDSLSNYFDPTNTDGASATNKALTLENLGGNTLDSKTIIISVSDDNSGSGYTVSGTSTGSLLSLTTSYSISTDRTGLPVFASIANNGTYFDEGGTDRVCRVDVIDLSTGQEMQTNLGNSVYAKMHDGADFSGTGTGTDVYMRFYSDGSVIDLTTVSGGAPSTVAYVYPQRKTLSSMNEYDWQRTYFISSWEGDVELVEDIQNLWAFIGSTDSDPIAGPWNNATANYLLNNDPSNLKAALDAINDGVGDSTYAGANYITSGESIVASLTALDTSLKTVADGLSDSNGYKFVESVSGTITKNIVHTIPYSQAYTPESTTGIEGQNMDVFVDGQLLSADTGTAGVNADRDYAESSTIQITFRFDVQEGRNITYVVRK